MSADAANIYRLCDIHRRLKIPDWTKLLYGETLTLETYGWVSKSAGGLNPPLFALALKQPLKENPAPDTLLQVLSKAFNTNSRACQEIFYDSKANPYRYLARNNVAYANKVRRREKVTICL